MTPVNRILKTVASNWLPALVIILALLAVWEGYVRIFDVQKWLLPSPTVIAATLIEDFSLLKKHTWITLVENRLAFFEMKLLTGKSQQLQF